MDDLKTATQRWLEERQLADPAQALGECGISLLHASPTDDRPAGSPPRADVLIHAPGELVSDIRKGKPPRFDWGNQIERAIRGAAGETFEVRLIQWVESGPADSPRPGTDGLGPSGGNAPA